MLDQPVVASRRPQGRKVYVDGELGVRVPWREVALSDSPGRGGLVANRPWYRYDTSGPGADP
jgi:phosphomethylpyrimidine synthase